MDKECRRVSVDQVNVHVPAPEKKSLDGHFESICQELEQLLDGINDGSLEERSPQCQETLLSILAHVRREEEEKKTVCIGDVLDQHEYGCQLRSLWSTYAHSPDNLLEKNNFSHSHVSAAYVFEQIKNMEENFLNRSAVLCSQDSLDRVRSKLMETPRSCTVLSKC